MMALVDRPFVAGLAMILAVCVIWTFSSVLVQRVEHERVSPLVLTYACNALFVVYLVPRLARRRGDAAPRARRDTTMSPARGGLALAPLWVGAQLLYNASLARTSVSSSTALSSTAGAFALLCAALAGVEDASWPKACGVACCVAGAGLVSAGDGGGGGARSLAGDACAVASAALCGAYTTLVARVAGGGDARDLLGFMGLWNGLLFAAPLGAYCALRDGAACAAPFVARPALVGWVVAKGLLDNVVADLLWAKAVVLTSPTFATVALNLTVPLGFAADALRGDLGPGAAWTGGGAAVIVAGVCLVAAAAAPAKPRGSLDAGLLDTPRARDGGGDDDSPWTAIVPCTPRQLLATPDYSEIGGLSDDDAASLYRPESARAGGLSDAETDRASPAMSGFT